MSTVLVVAGYGSGISHSVAKKFAKGHKLALIARSASKLQKAVDEFKKQNIEAQYFTADLGDTKAIADTFKKIQTTFGSVSMLLWNGAGNPKPLLASTPEELNFNFAANSTSLVAAVQVIQNDLEKNRGCVLITGGGFGSDNQQVTQYTVSIGIGSVGLYKAAVHKTTGILHEELKPKGVFVGEVVVNSAIKGTAWDHQGNATLEADKVADAFETLLNARSEPYAQIA